MKKVFLGGTCNDSQWREQLKPMLTIGYFDPVVDDWDEEAQQRELHERATCDFVLYVVTPRMKGVYSIAEVVDDSNKRLWQTLFCVLPEDDEQEFDSSQWRSLEAVMWMVTRNGGKVLLSLPAIANYLNQFSGPMGRPGWMGDIAGPGCDPDVP